MSATLMPWLSPWRAMAGTPSDHAIRSVTRPRSSTLEHTGISLTFPRVAHSRAAQRGRGPSRQRGSAGTYWTSFQYARPILESSHGAQQSRLLKHASGGRRRRRGWGRVRPDVVRADDPGDRLHQRHTLADVDARIEQHSQRHLLRGQVKGIGNEARDVSVVTAPAIIVGHPEPVHHALTLF